MAKGPSILYLIGEGRYYAGPYPLTYKLRTPQEDRITGNTKVEGIRRPE